MCFKVCLQPCAAVWDSLTKDEQETASTTFLSYADWFQKLKNETENNTSSEDTGLYEFLENARKRSGVKQTRIFDELNMDSDTYYSYKKRWEAFEKEGCKGAYPKKRLSRERLLFLAVFLDMDYYTTVGMLAIAGYSFHFGEPDITVAGYLLEKKSSKQDVINKLKPVIKQ